MFDKYRNKRRMARGLEIEDSIMTATQKEEAVIESPFKKNGLSVIWYIIILALVVLAGRVFYLDYYQGNYYAEMARNNRIREIAIKAPRGRIYDKYGQVLATNVPSLDAIIVPSDLPKDEASRKTMADQLAGILDLNSGSIQIQMDNLDLSSISPVLLKGNITQDQALIVSERAEEFPGIEIDQTAIRSYDNSQVFSPIIGYDGKITQAELKMHPDYLMTDYIGKTGLEESYEKDLRGTYGATEVEVDSLGRVQKVLGVINPVPGDDLILNIDAGLQERLYNDLEAMLKQTKTTSAAAVAIDPQTGGVLAMVSIPSYDNNLFARGISGTDYQQLINDSNLPLLNRCIAGTYPPGSTIKPAIATGALSEGVITPSTIVNGLGGDLRVGSYNFPDWTAHAPSNVEMAIAQSNDVFFYTVGGGYGSIKGLGMDRMKKWDNLFGLGEPTGIDIPGEADGLIPSPAWKEKTFHQAWYIGDSYHAAIGQGYVLVTPLQLADYTAAVANGGTLYSPRLVSRIQESDGQSILVPSKIVRSGFVSPEIAQVVRDGMRMTVTTGTAQILKNMPIPVAGKTGTAQFGMHNEGENSWFTSFAPFDKPAIAMAVLVPGGGEGNTAALPVTQDALKWYFTQDPTGIKAAKGEPTGTDTSQLANSPEYIPPSN